MDSKKLMEKARKTNSERDKIENIPSFPLDIQLRTAMSALSCGMGTKDWDCVAEAQGMLETIHLIMTGKEYRLD